MQLGTSQSLTDTAARPEREWHEGIEHFAGWIFPPRRPVLIGLIEHAGIAAEEKKPQGTGAALRNYVTPLGSYVSSDNPNRCGGCNGIQSRALLHAHLEILGLGPILGAHS